MTYRVQTKKSEVPGLRPHPSELIPGELAVNYSDMVLYAIDTSGVVQQISGSGGGGDCTNCPDYYGPQATKPTVGMKQGDIWFVSDGQKRALQPRTKQKKSLRSR